LASPPATKLGARFDPIPTLNRLHSCMQAAELQPFQLLYLPVCVIERVEDFGSGGLRAAYLARVYLAGEHATDPCNERPPSWPVALVGGTATGAATPPKSAEAPWRALRFPWINPDEVISVGHLHLR
jgi:hypothetical protein